MKLLHHVLSKVALVGSLWGALVITLSSVGRETVVVDAGLPTPTPTLVTQASKAIALFKKGREFYVRRNYEDALKAFKQVTEQEPTYADAWYWKGMTLYNQRDYQNAVVSFKKATQIDTKNPTFWKARGDAMNALAQYTAEQDTAIERYDLAVDAYDRALKFMPSNPLSDRAATWAGRSESLFAQGNLLSSRQTPAALQKYQDSITSYDEVIKLTVLDRDIDQQINALWGRGEALRKLGQYDDALASFNKSVELKPDFFEGWFRLGRVLQKQNKLQASIDAYTKALSFASNYAEAAFNRGLALKSLAMKDLKKPDMEKLEKAARSFNQSIQGITRNTWQLETERLNPEDPWYERGVVLGFLNCYPQAIASLDQAAKLNRNLEKVHDARKQLQPFAHRPIAKACQKWS